MPLQPATGAGGDGADLRRLHDVPVELAVEIGRTRMTIGQTLDLRPGSVVSLNRLAGEPVDLLINGKPIPRGEVVAIDEEFRLRITDAAAGSRNVEDEAAQQIEAEVTEAEHAVPGPLGEPVPDPLGTPPGDPFGGPAPDPLGTPPESFPSVDDLPLGGIPSPDAELP